MTPMAVKYVWVLTSILYIHGEPTPIHSQFHTLDNCRAAAIQEVESGNAKFAFCSEGYAAPLEYLPWSR